MEGSFAEMLCYIDERKILFYITNRGVCAPCEAVAVIKHMAYSGVEELLADLEAAGQRWRRRAAQMLEEAIDGLLVARKVQLQAVAHVLLKRGWPQHLALRAVHEAVAFIERYACASVEKLLAEREAAEKRRWR